METLDALARRIDTTADLQSIVRTMKSLSVVSIRQYERAAASLRDFNDAIELGLQAVLRNRPPIRPQPGPVAATAAGLAIVFGSDHGLCGQFNEQIAGFATQAFGAEVAPAHIIAAGFQAATKLQALRFAAETTLAMPGSAIGLSALTESILLAIDDWRASHPDATVELFYNERGDNVTAAPRRRRLLPIDRAWLISLQTRRWPSRSRPAHTMDAETLLSALIRRHLFVTLFRAAAESLASEHATRVASMQAAEKNIRDHLDEMHGDFYRMRQQAITEELLDVVAGFEVLTGGER